MPVDEDDLGLHEPGKFIRRGAWGGKPLKNVELPLRPLGPEVPYVRYTHTNTEKCQSQSQCTTMVQELQTQSLKEGLSDVKYNFLVGGDGKIYEGRGWAYEADRPAKYDYLAGKSIDIAYIGDYSNEHPSWDMLKAGWDVLKEGVKNKNVKSCFEVISYRDDHEEKAG